MVNVRARSCGFSFDELVGTSHRGEGPDPKDLLQPFKPFNRGAPFKSLEKLTEPVPDVPSTEVVPVV
jgi:hypothetical protein